MYTELIFGARLKENTDKAIIDNLKWLINGKQDEYKREFTFSDTKPVRCGSYYFGVVSCVNKIWYDYISKQWVVSIRANCKNYEKNIEKFLQWIKPYIDQGSGSKEMYAIVIYEEDSEPTIYYLED